MLAAVDAGGTSVGVLADSLEKTAQRRELREPIIEGTLALITPYHPAARFNVGHAMRRNSLIYCMAEAAVVVASAREKGGTTAGAIENLKTGWVPLYVRDDGTEGNADLIRRGGLPLPSDALDPEAPLPLAGAVEQPQELTLTGYMSDADATPAAASKRVPQLGTSPEPPALGEFTSAASVGEERYAADSAGRPDTEIFALAWPQIAAYLAEERSERDVSERFQLELSQTRAWLKRAVDEGLAKRLASKRRYIVSDRQRSLFAKST
jgi:predicted Rossmann fold nucleotide-binding protein DprA/Smf involved in DNA uptake